MKFIKITPLLSTALLLFSCSAETTSNMPVELSQIQQQWRLVDIDGQAIDAKVSSTLTISPPDKATGNLACNSFFGTLKLQNNKFKIEKMGSTRKMCSGKANNVEIIVSAVLRGWSEVQLNAQQLTLIGKEHRLNYLLKQ